TVLKIYDPTTLAVFDATSGAVQAVVRNVEQIANVQVGADGKTLLVGMNGKARGATAEVGSWPYEAISAPFASASGTKSLYVADDDRGTLQLVTPDRTASLATLASFPDGTWAVVDPLGRYDAANGGDIENLHWVAGNEH